MSSLIALRRLPQGYQDLTHHEDYFQRLSAAFAEVQEVKVGKVLNGFTVSMEMPYPAHGYLDDWMRDLIMDPVTKAPRLDLSNCFDRMPYSAAMTIMGAEFSRCFPLSSEPLVLFCGHR